MQQVSAQQFVLEPNRRPALVVLLAKLISQKAVPRLAHSAHVDLRFRHQTYVSFHLRLTGLGAADRCSEPFHFGRKHLQISNRHIEAVAERVARRARAARWCFRSGGPCARWSSSTFDGNDSIMFNLLYRSLQ